MLSLQSVVILYVHPHGKKQGLESTDKQEYKCQHGDRVCLQSFYGKDQDLYQKRNGNEHEQKGGVV